MSGSPLRRVSGRERTRALRTLEQARADGLLTDAEFETRKASVASSAIGADLDAALADLPEAPSTSTTPPGQQHRPNHQPSASTQAGQTYRVSAGSVFPARAARSLGAATAMAVMAAGIWWGVQSVRGAAQEQDAGAGDIPSAAASPDEFSFSFSWPSVPSAGGGNPVVEAGDLPADAETLVLLRKAYIAQFGRAEALAVTLTGGAAVVLVGGGDDAGLWRWSGTGWSQISPQLPSMGSFAGHGFRVHAWDPKVLKKSFATSLDDLTARAGEAVTISQVAVSPDGRGMSMVTLTASTRAGTSVTDTFTLQ